MGFRVVRPVGPALLLLVLLVTVLCRPDSSDYYDLLGVSKEATTREIRQAFKKLALTMHPDKNPGDPLAHDKFLRVNRAYEVLKDEDLRKKYDKYGEKGLDEQQGGRYESWNYYRYDFGIYDDDLEIITLDSGDFDAAVNSGEIWFINFYFPRCSHCHQLAPTWREFAKEMDGVIRIGAVNCGDNNYLCRRRGISSYPSLYIYRAGQTPEKFTMERTKEDLVRFSMQFITTGVTQLWQGNVFRELEAAFASSLSWLITFCFDTGDCLEPRTRQKLAGMLDGLVKVGWMDCTDQQQLCESFQVTSGATGLFPPDNALDQQDRILWLKTLDTKEIYSLVLNHLPDLELLTTDSFKDKLARHRWVVSFTFGGRSSASNEYKKLQAFLLNDHVQVGRVDCIADPALCQSLYVHKPCVAVFKGLGIQDFEIFHGKHVLYNIVAFARDSIRAHVTTLWPDIFPSDRKEPWLVDFFAPWCPPCRALLPELRKASIQLAGQIKFGTLDCTIHHNLCSMYNIQAYPTTMVFNDSSVHEYEGHHSAEGILEFIQDLVNPSVVILDPSSFTDRVRGRAEGIIWAVDFYAPWCGPCQALMPEWRRMARMLSGQILVGSLDCQHFQTFCRDQGVRAYPEIRLYTGSTKQPDRYMSYNGWHRDSQSLRVWALSALPRASVDLTPETFRSQVLAGQDHWVLDFYAPWCGPCQHFAPEFEVLARMLKGRVLAGKMDCQAHQQTCRSAGITAYPTLKFYLSQGTRKHEHSGEHINSRDADTIADIIRHRIEQQLPRLHSTMKDEL
ncbi:dnaJ homolog subfamily C member 10 [Nothobranchius furzeri]|uniref:DnaJ homolog subfamily C member 10 n=1 Tax=Nothobranchius furzeri TaxID=105023 RepID=A0A1A8V5H0_NOTFU|nr:dnaJ homolog subfamily C member 10 [Nothobranchius furzeri]XP_015830735.1 dnaJ homolog subfamily C member 10 [Nothobranchius furzeri]KAF7216180.1 transcript variant X1 [Nothobranchius furzeri]KAF7216181.1 transcript variant X2 [Nothobranchius furzeri]